MSEEVVEQTKTEENPTKGIRVFVYGTLKKDHYNHPILSQYDAEFLGRCYLKGYYSMLDLSAYPCVVRTDGSPDAAVTRIYGEVYRISEEALDALDILEGNGSFFTRSKVQTPWKNAWVYFLPTDYAERYKPISAGMWHPTDEEKEFWHGSESSKTEPAG